MKIQETQEYRLVKQLTAKENKVRLIKAAFAVTTFMVATDAWLQDFVNEFTETNGGRAFYTGLKGLGDLVFADYERNRSRKL